jgi:hypothetical protein
MLRGSLADVELRERDDRGEIFVTSVTPESSVITEKQMGREAAMRAANNAANGANAPANGNGRKRGKGKKQVVAQGVGGFNDTKPQFDPSELKMLGVYAYGVARNRLEQAAKRLHVPLSVVDDFDKANAVVTVKNYYRKRPRPVVDAEKRGMPVYVLRANTVSQMENFLIDLFDLEHQADNPFGDAMREAEAAILRISEGEEMIDLTPQSAHIRRQQHELIRQAQLASESRGKEPRRYVRVLSP